MKVKLNKEMVKKYRFHFGGDMSESFAIAVDHSGNPITYKEFMEKGGTIKVFNNLQVDEEFLVVNHNNPITKNEHAHFKSFFMEQE